MKKQLKATQELKPKLWTLITFITVCLFCLCLIIIRWINGFNPTVYVITPTINSHISNFVLSILGCLLLGYVLLLAGKNFKSSLIVGFLITLANFIYEIFLPILNTTDIIDAVYGLLGVCFSVIYLYFIGKYGFIDNRDKQ